MVVSAKLRADRLHLIATLHEEAARLRHAEGNHTTECQGWEGPSAYQRRECLREVYKAQAELVEEKICQLLSEIREE